MTKKRRKPIIQKTSAFLLLLFLISGMTGCLSTNTNKTITLDSDNLEYDNPLLQTEEIQKKTEKDIPSPNSETSPIAQVEIAESPFAENPDDLPENPKIIKVVPTVPANNKTTNTSPSIKNKVQKSQQAKTQTGNSNNKQNSANQNNANNNSVNETTSPASTTNTSPNEKRDVIAEIRGEGNSPFSIDLAGQGWAFRQDRGEKRPINYRGKENTPKGTQFRFTLPQEGSYLLTFVKQNNLTGRVKAYDVRVIIGSGDFDSGTVIEDPKGDSNLSPSQAIEKAIAKKDYSELNRLLNLHINNPTVSVRLLNAAYQSLKKSGKYEKMRLLLLYALEKRDNDILGLAFYYYEMARIYEQPGRFRDIKRSYKLYKKVYDNYPISVYSGKSKKRMEYIERHFLKVY